MGNNRAFAEGRAAPITKPCISRKTITITYKRRHCKNCETAQPGKERLYRKKIFIVEGIHINYLAKLFVLYKLNVGIEQNQKFVQEPKFLFSSQDYSTGNTSNPVKTVRNKAGRIFFPCIYSESENRLLKSFERVNKI